MKTRNPLTTRLARLAMKAAFLCVALVCCSWAGFTGEAHAATYTVTNTNDSGAGSLRYAMEQANYNFGNDTINFNIGGGGVKTITLLTDLPFITDDVKINGTSQPGYAGKPIIVLNGANLSAGKRAGLAVRHRGVEIRGLVLNGFPDDAIDIKCVNGCINTTPSLVVKNCYIGTNAAGNLVVANKGIGISIWQKDIGPVQIGGTGPNDGNVISGNWHGFWIVGIAETGVSETTPLVIQGNRIGTDASGGFALPNAGHGMRIIRWDSVVVGGNSAAARNLISGNQEDGVFCDESRRCNIKGNYIGTNAAGTAPIPNGGSGIHVMGGPAHKLGGSGDGEGNLISGNGGHGIRLGSYLEHNIYGTEAEMVTVYQSAIEGNMIGTNAAGTAALGNAGDGIHSASGIYNYFGKAGVAKARNIIAGNGGNGITLTHDHIWSESLNQDFYETLKETKVAGNFIGTNAAGADLGNTGHGIEMVGGAFNSIIGGENLAANVIAFNGKDGLGFRKGDWSKSPYGHQITANSIHSNDGQGISIYASFDADNDPEDADDGANTQQNAPVLTAAFFNRVQGTLHSVPNQQYRLDFYTSDLAPRSSTCERQGRTYLFTSSVTTDRNGDASFDVMGVNPGQIITATVTGPPYAGFPAPNGVIVSKHTYGSTSGFSKCLTVKQGMPGQISFSSASYSVGEGGGAATIHVNRGFGNAGGVTVHYNTVPMTGTATVGSDYAHVSGDITFAEGEMSKSFTIPVSQDALDEADETINLVLSNPTGGATLAAPSNATLTIADDDQTPALSVSDVAVNEGDAGTTTSATFTVSLSNPSAQAVTVVYETGRGTATVSEDYDEASGLLTFAPGQTTQAVAVTFKGDASDEPDEMIGLSLSRPTNATLADGEAAATIVDDDGEQMTAAIAPAADSLVEGINPAANFGAATEMRVQPAFDGPETGQHAYLKFDVSSAATVTSAKLRLYGRLQNPAGGGGDLAASVFGVADTTWDEAALTWFNRPQPAQRVDALAVAVISGEEYGWYEWDVTAYVQAEKAAGRGVLTLLLQSLQTDNSSAYAHFNSREACCNQPQLVIVP